MKADAMATRMSVLTRALPTRILLVDDDELELELMAERLTAAGFEITQALNGAEALEILERQWFPVVITDWQMPVMDGLALCESLRTRGGGGDIYVIMLTTREASSDYERGYAAGVDDYLTKKVQDPELFARIHAAFNTLALRRSLKQAHEALEESVALDEASGVFTGRETVVRLHAEICRAQRYGRQLSVITVGVAPQRTADLPATLSSDMLRGIAGTLSGVVRAHVDWVGRLGGTGSDDARVRSSSGSAASDDSFRPDESRAEDTHEASAGPEQEIAFAVVLPEAAISDGPAIKQRLVAALTRFVTSNGVSVRFAFGLAGLERNGPGGPAVHVEEMLDVAERCRICSGRVGTEQLVAVKQSVASHVAIACRHGYVVDSECALWGSDRQ